jgi:hypothetical protein
VERGQAVQALEGFDRLFGDDDGFREFLAAVDDPVADGRDFL